MRGFILGLIVGIIIGAAGLYAFLWGQVAYKVVNWCTEYPQSVAGCE